MTKIAVMQTNPIFGEVKSNLQTIKKLFPSSADIVVLPELCTTGYQFKNLDEVKKYSEDFSDSYSIDFLTGLARENSCVIVAGLSEKSGGKFYNSAVVISEKGLLETYRKINLFYRENLFFSAGENESLVVDVGFCKVGVMICFDWIFPNVARELAKKGADIICHSANLVLPFAQDAMITRSIENRVFTATANRIGSENRDEIDNLTFTGKSQITSHKGERLVSASLDKEEVIFSEIDIKLARNKKLNEFNELLK
ncbi:MAG: nitrilase-related carbon-nitrogen hydrolase [Candidatus Marinimicrobia bacterium]|nr:nitrilase-related carbon-nitrogen hydrolase [Candidatus Neomarinimicrobiota bacterium]